MPKDPRGWSQSDSAEATRFVLLRHGQTADSVHHLFSGSSGTDPELTELGHAQVRGAVTLLRQLVEDTPPAIIIASPLTRTRETAKYVSAALDLPVHTDPLLRECDFGQWEGRTMTQIVDDYPLLAQQWLRDITVPPPGGESIAQVNERIKEFRHTAIEQWYGQTIVVVSHVTPIKSIISQGLGEISEVFFRMYLDLASLSVVDFYGEDSSIVRTINLSV